MAAYGNVHRTKSSPSLQGGSTFGGGGGAPPSVKSPGVYRGGGGGGSRRYAGLYDYDAEAAIDNGEELDPLLSQLAEEQQLDEIPVFVLTHAVREEVMAAVDTTLTYDQLRTPQINQYVMVILYLFLC